MKSLQRSSHPAAVWPGFLLIFMILAIINSVSAFAEDKEAFSQAELDQMMAPIALYPDSLLSQILMASTYPTDVAQAVKWSKENESKKGDDAVKAVQNKPWDPSVMSLVAFPQVLDMMGKQPDWVQNVGDAFLADPEQLMNTVQKLRKKAKDKGNLESGKEMQVKSDSSNIIIIESSEPEKVYVPVYNPTIIYGTWWWPTYVPYYYYPPRYNPVAVGISFGIAIGVSHALWSNCNWRSHRIDINVNRYNNININKLDVNNTKVDWKHNTKHRKGTPYRDSKTRSKFSSKDTNINKRKEYRGRDLERENARKALENKGLNLDKQRQSLQGQNAEKVRQQLNNRNFDRSKNINTSREITRPNSTNSHALSGINHSKNTSRNLNRGISSQRSMRNFGGGGFKGRR
jgi:hypothetical protein